MAGDELFYKALERLNMGSDIHGCKNAAALLSEYLSDNPDSVMGDTLMKVIKEQLEE